MNDKKANTSNNDQTKKSIDLGYKHTQDELDKLSPKSPSPEGAGQHPGQIHNKGYKHDQGELDELSE